MLRTKRSESFLSESSFGLLLRVLLFSGLTYLSCWFRLRLDMALDLIMLLEIFTICGCLDSSKTGLGNAGPLA